MTVFLSHSHQDEGAYSALCAALDQAGVPRWDVSDLRPGQFLAEQLRVAIERCAVCVFLATARSLASAWCQAELGAFWVAKKRIFVFIADPTVNEALLPPQLQGTLCTKSATQLLTALTDALSKSSLETLCFLSKDDSARIQAGIQSAERINILGATLSSVKRRRHDLENALKNGAIVRVLVTDLMQPENSAHLAFRSYWAKTSASVESGVTSNLENLAPLREEFKNTFVFRTLPIDPTYAMLIIDGPNDVSLAQVKLLTFGAKAAHKTFGPKKTHPRFEITKATDTWWYNYFLDQFERMWDESDDFPA